MPNHVSIVEARIRFGGEDIKIITYALKTLCSLRESPSFPLQYPHPTENDYLYWYNLLSVYSMAAANNLI